MKLGQVVARLNNTAERGIVWQLVKLFAQRVQSFSGPVLAGFAGSAAGEYESLRHAFGKSRRRGLMAIPKPSRIAVKGLLAERTSTIEETDISALVKLVMSGEK